jgi:hypothetical protein
VNFRGARKRYYVYPSLSEPGRTKLMKRFALAIVVISVLGWCTLVAQSNSPKVMAEFAGASLKWIHAAEPEFQRRKLDLSNYTVSVIEKGDSVTVVLKSLDAVEGVKGSSGSYPAYEVEISKKDLRIVRSNYVR